MSLALLLSACSTPAPVGPPAPAPTEAPAPPPAAAPPEPAAAPAPVDRPPTIASVVLGPAKPAVADSLKVDVVATDPEGGRLDLDYAWTINGAPVPGAGSERLGGRFAKGDTVRVRVTADDGTTEVSADSEELVIGNTAPVFQTGPRDMKKVDGFTFRATDADADPLTWRIESAPRGMSISPKGVLAYQGSEDEPGGDYTVAVVVEDGEAWGRFEFPLTVSPGSKAKK